MVLLILLASFGMGFTISLNRKEEYRDREIKIEQTKVKDDESESELMEQKGNKT